MYSHNYNLGGEGRLRSIYYYEGRANKTYIAHASHPATSTNAMLVVSLQAPSPLCTPGILYVSRPTVQSL